LIETESATNTDKSKFVVLPHADSADTSASHYAEKSGAAQ